MAVHRYKATESDEPAEVVETKKAVKKTVKKSTKTAAKTVKNDKPARKTPAVLAPLVAFKGYFVGSWRELRQVRWPNRKQTWALSLAVILFSLALGALIFALDAGFTLLFKKVIF